VQELTRSFVVVADDSYRLETENDPECRFFKRLFQQSSHGPSSQGTYIFTPGGTLLESNGDSYDAQKMAATLRRAIRKWNALSVEERRDIGKSSALRRGETIGLPGQQYYPKDGLVLRLSYRDLPRGYHYSREERWNEDFAWFTKREARNMLPQNPAVGQSTVVPGHVVERLVRFHLIDQVRGEGGPFDKEHIKSAKMTTNVTGVRNRVVTLELRGETDVSAAGHWGIKGKRPTSHQQRGFRTKLLGHAEYDLRKERFVRFDMVALGVRWGGTAYNMRYDDLAENPIGVSFTLAGRGRMERLRPKLFWAYPK